MKLSQEEVVAIFLKWAAEESEKAEKEKNDYLRGLATGKAGAFESAIKLIEVME